MKIIFTNFFLVCSLGCFAQQLSLAPNFGNNGAVTVDVAAGGDILKEHVFTSEGGMIIGGEGYDIATNSYHVTLVAIDPICGTLDTAFGDSGAIGHIFEQRTRCYSIALQPDGKIVGCGMIAPSNAGSQQWPGVFRFNSDGSVDSTFNGTGYHRLQFGAGAGDLTKIFVNDDGTITCTAAAFTGMLGAMRFLPDGSLDTTFNNTGITSIQLPSFAQSAEGSGVMLPDGSVITVGIAFNGVDYALMLAKFDVTGAVDSTFGNNGMVVSNVLAHGIGKMGVVLESGGAILVSGTAIDLNIMLMTRFLPDGSLDTSFGTDGVSQITTTTGDGNGLIRMDDGSTLQFGRVNNIGGIAKRDENGDVDIAFGTNGLLALDAGIPGTQTFMNGALLSDGRIIAYGTSNAEAYIAKLTEDPIADGLPVITQEGSDLVTTATGDIQWYLDSLPIDGANSSTYTPTENGSYTVTVTTGNCEISSEPFLVLSVGIQHIEMNGLRILENPVAGTLTLVNDATPADFTIFDHEGRMVHSGRIDSGLNAIDLRNLASGIYFLRAAKSAEGIRFVVF